MLFYLNILIIFFLTIPIFSEKKTVIFKDGKEKVIDITYSNNDTISGIDILTNEKVTYKATDYVSISTYLDFYENHRKVIVKKDKTYIKGLSESENLKRIILKPDKSQLSITIETKDIAKDGLLPINTFNQEFNKNKNQAALRSTILPGWGQFYSGNVKKGVFFSFFSIVALGLGVNHYLEANKNLSEYHNTYFPQDSMYSNYTDQLHAANNAFLGFGILYLLNIGDAYFGFKNKYEGYKEYEIINTQIPNKKAAIEFSYTWRF